MKHFCVRNIAHREISKRKRSVNTITKMKEPLKCRLLYLQESSSKFILRIINNIFHNMMK